MALEDEMRAEIRKLEKEIALLDEDMAKLHDKLVQYIMLKKKKEHEMKVLKANFMEELEDRDVQTSLAALMKKRFT